MRSTPREDVPIVIDDNGVEVRLRDEDGLSVDFSPTEEFRRVIEHITSGARASA
jgi:hypothetical protein